MESAIKIKNLTKSFDNFSLNIANLEIPKGTIVGLIGENGAGKTTLIKCILNIIQSYEGNIKILNKNAKEKLALKDVGVVLDGIFFPESLKVKDISVILKNIYKNWDNTLFTNLLNEFNIQKDVQIKTLSKGMHKKLEIATSLAHKPKLLILDEPTSNLDPIVRNEVLDLFRTFLEDEDHTILFSTHITSDLENIADKLLFLNDGQIILSEDMDTIRESYGLIKCDASYFTKIKPEDILKYRQNKYDYEVIVKNKNNYVNDDNIVVEKLSIEDLMVLMIKGE